MITRILKDKNQLKSFLYLLIRGISVGANFLFIYLAVRFYSKDLYGQYISGLSAFMMISVFLKAGIDVHFVKLYAEFDPMSIPRWVKKVENKVMVLTVLISILTAVGIYFFYSPENEALVLIIFILSVPFHVKVFINSGKLRGISRITEFAFLNIAGRIVFTLLFLVAAYFTFLRNNSYALSLSHFFAILLLFLVSIYWTGRAFAFSKDEKNAAIPKSFISYNTSLLLKSYVTVFFLWGDRFLFSLVADSSEVAKYDVSLKIGMVIMIVAEALKSTYAPVFAKNAPDSEQFMADVKKSVRMGFGFSIMLFLFILIFGKFLLELLAPGFQDSYRVLLVISVGYTIAAFFGQSDNILEMTGLVKHYLFYYFLIIVLSLALGVMLSISFGALGMAIGVAAGNIIFQAIASYIVKSKMGIKTTFL